jgi:hypothetical protein
MCILGIGLCQAWGSVEVTGRPLWTEVQEQERELKFPPLLLDFSPERPPQLLGEV